MLDVVGVCAIAVAGRTSTVVFGKLSWPGIGESEKNCCCMTGSTDAATELVESATLRSTLSAIQSLGATGVSTDRHARAHGRHTHSKNSFKIWNAPNAGSLRMVYRGQTTWDQHTPVNRPAVTRLTRSRMTWLVT